MPVRASAPPRQYSTAGPCTHDVSARAGGRTARRNAVPYAAASTSRLPARHPPHRRDGTHASTPGLFRSSGRARSDGPMRIGNSGREVHPLNRHNASPSSSRGRRWPLTLLGRSRWHVLDTLRPPNSENDWIAPQCRSPLHHGADADRRARKQCIETGEAGDLAQIAADNPAPPRRARLSPRRMSRSRRLPRRRSSCSSVHPAPSRLPARCSGPGAVAVTRR